jgi:uncharacterized membrane protein YgcG
MAAIDVTQAIVPSGSFASRFAMVTLVMNGDEYVPGALATASSAMKAGMKCTYLVMVTPDVSQEARDALSEVYKVIEVDKVEHPVNMRLSDKQHERYDTWISASFTKWRALCLTDYEAVMFVDADMVFRTNCDHLFRMSKPAACFSNAWVKTKAKGKGMASCYTNLTHGKSVDSIEIGRALTAENGYVLQGCLVMLVPSASKFERLVELIKINPDGFGSDYNVCCNAADELSLTLLYQEARETWYHIGIDYIAIPWKAVKWDSPDCHRQLLSLKALHYGGKNVWTMGRTEWPDTKYWWSFVDLLLEDRPHLKRWFKDPSPGSKVSNESSSGSKGSNESSSGSKGSKGSNESSSGSNGSNGSNGSKGSNESSPEPATAAGGSSNQDGRWQKFHGRKKKNQKNATRKPTI